MLEIKKVTERSKTEYLIMVSDVFLVGCKRLKDAKAIVEYLKMLPVNWEANKETINNKINDTPGLLSAFYLCFDVTADNINKIKSAYNDKPTMETLIDLKYKGE